MVARVNEIILVRAVQTCQACLSQWDAWDLDGRYWYLRFRHGHGTMGRDYISSLSAAGRCGQPDRGIPRRQSLRVNRRLRSRMARLMTALIPDGLEPIAVWDCNDRDGTWWTDGMPERIKWAKANVPRVNDTLRLDFYLLDAPFMVAYRIKRDLRGKLAQTPAGEPMLDEPVIVPLAELPPAHLLKG
jgi:hypothetical protein